MILLRWAQGAAAQAWAPHFKEEDTNRETEERWINLTGEKGVEYIHHIARRTGGLHPAFHERTGRDTELGHLCWSPPPNDIDTDIGLALSCENKCMCQ